MDTATMHKFMLMAVLFNMVVQGRKLKCQPGFYFEPRKECRPCSLLCPAKREACDYFCSGYMKEIVQNTQPDPLKPTPKPPSEIQVKEPEQPGKPPAPSGTQTKKPPARVEIHNNQGENRDGFKPRDRTTKPRPEESRESNRQWHAKVIPVLVGTLAVSFVLLAAFGGYKWYHYHKKEDENMDQPGIELRVLERRDEEEVMLTPQVHHTGAVEDPDEKTKFLHVEKEDTESENEDSADKPEDFSSEEEDVRCHEVVVDMERPRVEDSKQTAVPEYKSPADQPEPSPSQGTGAAAATPPAESEELVQPTESVQLPTQPQAGSVGPDPSPSQPESQILSGVMEASRTESMAPGGAGGAEASGHTGDQAPQEPGITPMDNDTPVPGSEHAALPTQLMPNSLVVAQVEDGGDHTGTKQPATTQEERRREMRTPTPGEGARLDQARGNPMMLQSAGRATPAECFMDRGGSSRIQGTNRLPGSDGGANGGGSLEEAQGATGYTPPAQSQMTASAQGSDLAPVHGTTPNSQTTTTPGGAGVTVEAVQETPGQQLSVEETEDYGSHPLIQEHRSLEPFMTQMRIDSAIRRSNASGTPPSGMPHHNHALINEWHGQPNVSHVPQLEAPTQDVHLAGAARQRDTSAQDHRGQSAAGVHGCCRRRGRTATTQHHTTGLPVAQQHAVSLPSPQQHAASLPGNRPASSLPENQDGFLLLPERPEPVGRSRSSLDVAGTSADSPPSDDAYNADNEEESSTESSEDNAS